MTPIDAARAVLPEVVPWGNAIVLAPLAFAVSLLAMYVATSIALRPLEAAMAWWERARDAHTARVIALLGVTALPAAASILVAPMTGPLSRLPSSWLQALVAAATFCAGAVVAAHVESVVRMRRVTALTWLRDALFAALVVSPHVFFPVVGGILTTHVLVDRTALGCGISLAAVAFWLAGGGFMLARALGLVRAASPRTQGIVTVAAAAAGVERPRNVYEFQTTAANAFALGTRKVALTTGALALMGDDDLIALMVHELGHLAQPRRALVRQLALRALQALVFVAALPLTEVIGTWALFVAAYAALIVFRVRLRFDREAEVAADATAVHHEADAGAYARALERVHAVNGYPAVLGVPNTHPDLYDRMLAAGVTPSFARPLPPTRGLGGGVFLLATAAAIAGGVLVRSAIFIRSSDATDEGPIVTEIAVSGGSAFSLTRLGSLRAERGDVQGALALLHEAVVLAPNDPFYAAKAAVVLAPVGRCDEAQRYLAEAEAIERRLSGKEPEATVVDAQRAVAACHRPTASRP